MRTRKFNQENPRWMIKFRYVTWTWKPSNSILVLVLPIIVIITWSLSPTLSTHFKTLNLIFETDEKESKTIAICVHQANPLLF